MYQILRDIRGGFFICRFATLISCSICNTNRGQNTAFSDKIMVLIWIKSNVYTNFLVQLNKYETAQLHIFSIRPKLYMRLFVDFCVLPLFYLNLPDLNLKLFWTSKQNNFRFRSGTGKNQVKHRNQRTIECQVLV